MNGPIDSPTPAPDSPGGGRALSLDALAAKLDRLDARLGSLEAKLDHLIALTKDRLAAATGGDVPEPPEKDRVSHHVGQFNGLDLWLISALRLDFRSYFHAATENGDSPKRLVTEVQYYVFRELIRHRERCLKSGHADYMKSDAIAARLRADETVPPAIRAIKGGSVRGIVGRIRDLLVEMGITAEVVRTSKSGYRLLGGP